MKKILEALIIFGLMTGCGGNAGGNSSNTNTGARASVAVAQGITMTLKPKGDAVNIFAGGNGKATVDWGDGTPVETVKLVPVKDIRDIDINDNTFEECNMKHTYARLKEYTIKITGENITALWCEIIGITALELNVPALTWLICNHNQLTTLDLGKNTALKHLECYENKLTALDLSNNTALKYLTCHTNQIKSLDVSKNTALQYFDCSKNKLTALDVSKNTALERFSCYNNQLTTLDVSKNTALFGLYCGENQLKSLDLSKNTKLRRMNCQKNQLSAEALNAMFHTLCETNNEYNFCSLYGNPGTETCDRSIARKKGWLL